MCASWASGIVRHDIQGRMPAICRTWFNLMILSVGHPVKSSIHQIVHIVLPVRTSSVRPQDTSSRIIPLLCGVELSRRLHNVANKCLHKLLHKQIIYSFQKFSRKIVIINYYRIVLHTYKRNSNPNISIKATIMN